MNMIEHVLEPSTFWEQVATTRWGRYTTQIEEEAICKALRLAGAPGVALDVGCEGGRWSRLIADSGWTVTCTEVDAEALEVCRRRVPSATCLLVEPNATTLPCPDSSVDLLICMEVFPVIESAWFLREARRVLSDNGLLVGVTLNRRSPRGLFVRVKKSLSPAPHIHYQRSYSAWSSLARAEGFRLSYQRGFCWFPLSRTSNSVFAPLFARGERLLGLSRLTALSPWVAFVARKHLGVSALQCLLWIAAA